MKSSTIRVIVILALLATAGIITTQVYWVRKAFALNEQRFNLNVAVALRNVAASVMRGGGVQGPKYSPVEQLSPDYFIVQTNAHVDQAVLQDRLVEAFTNQDIQTDFHYGLSDCEHPGAMEYTGYYRLARTPERTSAPASAMPVMKRENHYFGVYFPHRKAYLKSQLTVWIVSSVLLLCVIGFLCYLLYIIFRQRRLSEVQKDFVTNMTHEFKTPLSAISLSADVLKNPAIGQQPQRLLNYATIIANEAMQLSGQIERILQMTKMEREGLPLSRSALVWQELLRGELPAYRKAAQAKNGVVSLDLPEETIHFTGDMAHLKNALLNLIDNAVKYCTESPNIRIILRKGARMHSITVQDNGIGIDKARQRMLFEKFYRVPTGNVHDVKGFGLGLNYVRLIARAHGGDVSCDSRLGEGSIFTLIFPNA